MPENPVPAGEDATEASTAAPMIGVEVVYGLPDRQALLPLEVPEGCTALEAVRRSDIIALFPEIDPDNAKMGIFGKVVENPATTVLHQGDRVEIYRPLLVDPKESRRKRAAKAKAARDASRREKRQGEA